MKNKMLGIAAAGLMLLLAGCETTGGSAGSSSAAATGRYGNWETSQLLAKRTELMKESSQIGFGGAYQGTSSQSYQRGQIAQELDEVNAELAARGVQ